MKYLWFIQPRARQRDRAVPRRARRGLGLFDTLLAVAVLSVLGLFAAQVLNGWIAREVIAGEARELAHLSRAGKLYVQGDPMNHRPGGSGYVPVTFMDLEREGLWRPDQLQTTPNRRRIMELFLLNDPRASDRVLVIARARGAPGDPRRSGIPGAEAGVPGIGVILDGETVLRGPGIRFDMADYFSPAQTADFARPGDLFALNHVWIGQGCVAYLHRNVDPGCADATVMGTDLDLGGNALEGVGRLVVTGTAEIGGDVTVGEDMLGGNVIVDGDVTATGIARIAGDVTVSGEITAPQLTTGATIEADTVEFNNVTVTDTLVTQDLIADSCTGCGP